MIYVNIRNRTSKAEIRRPPPRIYFRVSISARKRFTLTGKRRLPALPKLMQRPTLRNVVTGPLDNLGSMEMADDAKKVGDLMEQAQEMLSLNRAVGPQMEGFWKAQGGILEETEAFSKAWFERRHDSAKAALEAVRKANGDGAAPSAAMQAMIDWHHGSFRRMAEDMQKWVELCSRCASRMTQAEVDAGKEGAEEIIKRAKSAAKTKHATPV